MIRTHLRLRMVALLAVVAIGLHASRVPAQISAGTLHSYISYLASDALKGRGSGEKGNELAAKYVAEAFKRAGLKPLGTSKQMDAKAQMDGSGYYQPFTFLAGVAKGNANSLKARVGKKIVTYKLGQAFEPSTLSASGPASEAVVFAGHGIRSKEAGRDDYAGVNAAGKIVLVLEGVPGNDPHSPIFEHADLRRKAMTAREAGAIALIVAPLGAGDVPRFNSDTAPADVGIPVVMISRAVAASWLKSEGKDIAVIEASLKDGPGSFNTQVAAYLHADVRKVTKTTANIAGLLEGSDPTLKAEAVVIGAHMDHLGMGGSHSLAESKKPAIHHGADDNASGTAGVMALAEHFTSRTTRPKRSIVFMCFSGEELGLLGSAYYVKNPLVPIASTSAMINLDMIGRVQNNKLNVIGVGTSPSWPALVTEANSETKFDLSLGDGGFGGSDHMSFSAAKVPVLFFFSGVHADYHRPSDTAEKINAMDTQRVVQLVGECAAKLVDVGDRPVYTEVKVAQVDPGRLRARASLGSIPEYGGNVDGVPLGGVRPGSPADKAGLKKGDIIVKFAGRTIKNVEEYTLALGDAKPGDVVTIEVKRDGAIVVLTATLAESRR